MTNFTHLLAERRRIEESIEVCAVMQVRDWLVAHQLTEVQVDDANENPSYAYDADGHIIDDDELDGAISWIPSALLHNPTKPAWNPIIRVQDLCAFLEALAEATRQQPSISGGRISIESDQHGTVIWSGLSDSDIDKVCAFVNTIKPPEAVTETSSARAPDFSWGIADPVVWGPRSGPFLS
jgi:hypothetical protein